MVNLLLMQLMVEEVWPWLPNEVKTRTLDWLPGEIRDKISW